jgi:hypothetical protein
MAEIIGGSKVEAVYLCPECGSPSLEYPYETGLVATCLACGWSGKQDQMLVTPIVHQEGSVDNMVSRLINDLRRILSNPAFGVPFGKFLMKWGFIDKKPNTKILGRYFASCAVGIVTALIKERQKIEKERASGS